MGLLLRWLAPFVAILEVAYLLPGSFAVQNLTAAAVFALVLAVLNAFVRPVVEFFTLPLTCLTFGLFHLVINTVMFALAATLVQGVSVNGVGAAFIGALAVSIVGALVSQVRL